MMLAWRSLLRAVVAVPMDGLAGAVLPPEDRCGSDPQLGRLRAVPELSPLALDEDPIRHVATYRQKGGLTRDFALIRRELRCYPLPTFADFGPAAFDPTPEPTLTDRIGVGAQSFHGFGIAVGDGSASRSLSRNCCRVSVACKPQMQKSQQRPQSWLEIPKSSVFGSRSGTEAGPNNGSQRAPYFHAIGEYLRRGSHPSSNVSARLVKK